MKRIILPLLCVGMFTTLNAQDESNLVNNPSFEAVGKKLGKLKQLNKAEFWDSPTALRADLYNADVKEGPVTVPENIYGKEYPMDGDSYAGIVMYSYNNKAPRTYLQTQLIAPLRKDVEYCVRYHVSLADLSKYAVNNFGAYFSKDPFEVEGKVDIIFDKEKDKKNMVLPTDNKLYNARYNWEPVCFTYKASGKESFLIIGNFSNNKETDYEKLKKLANFKGTQVPLAYYYIDQIEVFIPEDPSECICNKAESEVAESVVYNKELTSEEVISFEDQVKFATVYFDVKSSDLENNMKKDLDILAGALKANPEYNLKLHGHLDALEGGALRKNPEDPEVMDLDNKRVESVKAYLISKGLDESRILTSAHKDKNQASIGSTSLDHAKNRRVEFTLIEK